jgi:hypothetical protein
MPIEQSVSMIPNLPAICSNSLNRATGGPEAARDDNSPEVAGRLGDGSIHGHFGQCGPCANLSECWHSIH